VLPASRAYPPRLLIKGNTGSMRVVLPNTEDVFRSHEGRDPSIGKTLTRNSDPVRGVSAMLSDVFYARLPRLDSPHVLSRSRGAIAGGDSG